MLLSRARREVAACGFYQRLKEAMAKGEPQLRACLSATGAAGSSGASAACAGTGGSVWAGVQELVVYGLGSPQSSLTSRYQVRSCCCWLWAMPRAQLYSS